MKCVRADQIIAGLCQRGFDARILGGKNISVGQHPRGVVIHGVCVLGWRYPDGRWEFTDRPPRLIEPDNNSGCWIWDNILSDCCRPVASVSDPAHMITQRITELLTADPNKPRALCFPDFWVWDKACLYGAEAPEQWYRQWSDHLFDDLRPEAARAGYSPHTARIADFMCSPGAFTAYPEQQAADGGGQVYHLAPDVPAAGPLLSRLLQINIRTELFNLGTTRAHRRPGGLAVTVDDFRQYLAWDHQQLASDREPDLRPQHGHSPRSREVALRVGPDGRMLVRRNTTKPNQRGAQQ